MIHTFTRGNDLYANMQDVSYKQAVTIDGQTYEAQGLNADLTARLLVPVQPATVVCDECGERHPAEYSHEGRFNEGPIYAVVCTVDHLTDFYSSERIERTA